MRRGTVFFLAGVLLAGVSQAGQAGAPIASTLSSTAPPQPLELPFAIDGPPVPAPPAVVSRDAEGRATVRAVRLTTPLRLDGRLDEAIYASVPPISDFIQMEPQEGAPATEKTEMWITFDRNNVYVSFRCWETQPGRIIANEMRRDNATIFQGNDNIGIIFDTFYDRRNAVLFEVNPIGGRLDGQVTNERQFSMDWNPIWDVEVGRFGGGWTVEMAVPFKSLRYRPGRAQIWGFNVRRSNRWKNESSFLTRIPNALGARALFQASLAATLVGLEAPPGARNLAIKPYAISDLTTDVNASPKHDVNGDLGLDVKYGVTQSLVADFTYNTDFAQVEADEQQVNLTRFSLFFPEKREFFLENQGLFGFGGAATGGASETPILFYSRRIGLHQRRSVPIDAGGRLTGRVGRYSLGLLNIQTDDGKVSTARPTNFSVVRLKRDLLRRSSVGLVVTQRSVRQTGSGSNTAYGVDGTFAFFDNLAINTYWARTRTSTFSGDDDTSYRAQLDYAGDRYGVQVEHLIVGNHFNPEVGFVRRDDMRRSFGQVRFSPRPRASKLVRRLVWQASMTYIENGVGRVDTRDIDGGFGIEFQNSDRFNVGYSGTYEFLPVAFTFPSAPGVTVPVGGYDYASARVGFQFGQQRKMSGNLQAEFGAFYSGHKATLGVSRGRLNLRPQLSLEPAYQVNWVDLPEGSFTTHLLGSRVTYTITPLMFASALLQYSSDIHTVTSNVRLRWEYRPGSELFIVYNDERDTRGRRFPDLANRALIVKITRLFRF